MKQILFHIIQWLIFCSNLTRAEPIVGTITRSARNTEFSSVVAIGNKYFGPDLASQLFCTGTLITRRHVLTAAHCIVTKIKENVQVFGGSSHIEMCDRYDIEYWIMYNDWAADNNLIPEYTLNDIALITLDRNTDETKMTPAMISPEVSLKHEGLTGAIAGWGRLNDDSKPAVLQTANVEILELDECGRRCSEITGCSITLPGRYMCSAARRASIDEWATTSCGDSGGPLLFNKRILLAVNLGICPTGAEPHESMNYHISLNYYAHFFHHLTKEGLKYQLLHVL